MPPKRKADAALAAPAAEASSSPAKNARFSTKPAVAETAAASCPTRKTSSQAAAASSTAPKRRGRPVKPSNISQQTARKPSSARTAAAASKAKAPAASKANAPATTSTVPSAKSKGEGKATAPEGTKRRGRSSKTSKTATTARRGSGVAVKIKAHIPGKAEQPEEEVGAVEKEDTKKVLFDVCRW